MSSPSRPTAPSPSTSLLAALAGAVSSGRLDPAQPAHEALRRIRAAAPLGAVLGEVDPEPQLQRLRERLAGPESLPLAGVPVIVKDNLSLRGSPTTCGSRLLEHYVSPYTATAVTRLMDAGAIIVGRANMDEFGMGSSTEHSAYAPARNPWDTGRVPGGSSGGSAAALAARLSPLTLGSDTGGSIRQPAAFCGVYGLKPSYGRVSRSGLVAYASSLDTVGPLALSAADLALAMGVMSGPDPLDATSLPDTPDFGGTLDLGGLRVGVIAEGLPGVSGGVAQVLDGMRAALQAAGATVEEVSLPHLVHAVPTYYLIAMAEASSNLSRFDGMHYGQRAGASGEQGGGPDDGATRSMIRTRETYLGAEVQKRIMLGTFVLSSGYSEAYYTKALQVRRLIADEFAGAFGRYDVLLTPTSPFTAFRLGEKGGSPLEMYAADVNTVAINLAGVPALNVPAGFEEVNGVRLPVGLQFIGPVGADARLTALAAALEAAGAVDVACPPEYAEWTLG